MVAGLAAMKDSTWPARIALVASSEPALLTCQSH